MSLTYHLIRPIFSLSDGVLRRPVELARSERTLSTQALNGATPRIECRWDIKVSQESAFCKFIVELAQVLEKQLCRNRLEAHWSAPVIAPLQWDASLMAVRFARACGNL